MFFKDVDMFLLADWARIGEHAFGEGNDQSS